jgi:hypothetical protein
MSYKHILKLLVIFLCVCITHKEVPGRAAPVVPTGLSPADQTLMTTNLQILSTGWVQESVDICNSILAKPEYTAVDWTEFFSGYFASYPFTYELYGYLNYPLFWWFGDDVHLKLQEALIVATCQRIDATMTEHGNDLSAALSADANLRITFAMSHIFLKETAHYGVVGQARLQELYDYYVSLVEAWPQYWKKSSTIDINTHPYIAALAAQVQANLRDFLPLTPDRKAEIATVLDLQGSYLDLWNDFTLLLFDNNGFDQPQLNFLYAYVASIPGNLLQLEGISQVEFIGNVGDTAIPLSLDNINVFGTRIGQGYENAFPEDVSPVACDGFLEVVAHEANHNVDGIYVSETQYLNNKRKELVTQAGANHMNYLRSMFEDGFFKDAPQEFLASIANQWACDSEHTVKLGLVRFDAGIPEPLNQALFYADLYSAKTLTSTFYTADLMANLTLTDVPLQRDWLGRVNSLSLPSGEDHFVLDEYGIVSAYGMGLPQVQVQPLSGWSVLIPQGETETRTLVISNTGDLDLNYGLDISGTTSLCGHSIGMSGMGYVEVANSSSLNPTNQMTLEAWIAPQTWEGGNRRVAQKGYGDDQFRLLTEGGDFKFGLGGKADTTFSYWRPITDTWTHVAGVYDGSQALLYINGRAIITQALTGMLNLTSDPLFIGSKDSWPSDGFIGQLDEVRLWNVARTAQEIHRDMYRELTGDEAGLVGYWRFNEANGSLVQDSTLFGNDGMAYGDASSGKSPGPVCHALRVDTRYGILPPGETATLQTIMGAPDLPAGSYMATLLVHSSDPEQAVVSIPIHIYIYSKQIYLPWIVSKP